MESPAAQHPDGEVQAIQSAHRRRLLETWQIPEGSRILELGCGQGDMTAVLAETAERILAVDVADPSYGAPLTLGQAADLLKASQLGDRIDFRFNFDILDPSVGFEDDAFDAAVMAHSSWYFASLEDLKRTLTKIQPWASRLCFAEWDLVPQTQEQTAHMLAVLIQGQIEAFKTESHANVRTPFAKDAFKTLLAEAGWTIAMESYIDTTNLQDADWEVATCLSFSLSEAKSIGLPSKFLALLEGQVEVLKQIAAPKGNSPLPCYSIVTDRR